MVKHKEVDEFFRRLRPPAHANTVLPANASLPAERKSHASLECRQLLSAFNKIEDPRLRQELLVLIEIVAKMPGFLPSRGDCWLKGSLAKVH